MRDPGEQRVDSSVGDDVMPSAVEQQRHHQQHMEIGPDGHFDLGDEVLDEGGAATEVSTGCFSRLSPTFIVYMSAFVSSLTSVLLGYGECVFVCKVCVSLRRNLHASPRCMCLVTAQWQSCSLIFFIM